MREKDTPRSKGLRDALENDSWVKPYFHKYRRELATALGFGLLVYLFASLLMFTSGYLISRTAEEGCDLFLVLAPVGLVQIFGLGKPLLRYAERLLSHDWIFRMTSSLRLRLYTVLESGAMRIKRTHQTGDFLGLVAEDIGHIQNLYLRSIFPTVIAWGAYIVVVIALGLFSLPFALFMLLAFAVEVLLLPYVAVLVNRARMDRRKAAKSKLYTQLTDNVLGASDWVFAGRGDDYLERLGENTERVRADEAAINRYARINDLVAVVCFAAMAIVTCVWAAGQFGAASTGDVSGGAANWIAAFVLGLFPLADAFMPLPMAATQATGYRDSIERMNALPETGDSWSRIEEELDRGSEFTGIADIIAGRHGAAHTESDLDALTRHEPAPELALMEGLDLDIEEASYAYPGSARPVLDNLTMHIAQGSKVAILGRSGSGKSTLASLIRGDIKPDSGTVELGGVSCAAIVEDMPSFIGVVAQRAYLFNRTLRENLTIGAPGAADEDIWRALDAVELDEMVRALPDGLDTLVDESGSRFSGGERHRIALARVLLADVPIVLLDEPTVGLDPITEQALLDTLFRVLEGKTLVMITHHLQSIESFDRVVFVEDGRIEIDGSPAELLATNERYRQLLEFDRFHAL